MTSDEQLWADVAAELLWDPRVHSDAIAVLVDGGTVTLGGAVESTWQKHAAGKAAERVRGVVGVVNELVIGPLEELRRGDWELRGDVLRAFTLNAIVPPTVDVGVEQGRVTLHGRVRWQFERAEAQTVAARVPGVTGVLDEIVLASSQSPPADVRQAIHLALLRSAELDVGTISIRTTNRTVSLTGTVRSWSQHDAALAAAWAAPGVQQVQDGLNVSYDR